MAIQPNRDTHKTDFPIQNKRLIRKIGRRQLIPIPVEMMLELGLEEGDFFEIRIENKEIILHPKRLVDLD